jgi:hypothetical protein
MKTIQNLVLLFVLMISILSLESHAQKRNFEFYELTEAYFTTELGSFDLLEKNHNIAPFGIQKGAILTAQIKRDSSFITITEPDAPDLAILNISGRTRATDSSDLYKLSFNDSTGMLIFPPITIKTLADGKIYAPNYLLGRPKACIYKELFITDHPETHKTYYLFSIFCSEYLMFQLICTPKEDNE